MKIVHELNQLDFGGVERVINNIVKLDKGNEHTIVTYHDGLFRKTLEESGAKILIAGKEEVDVEADIIHIHTGGNISKLGYELGDKFPIIETIHSPIRSPMPNKLIKQRIGVTDTVSKLNDKCQTIYNGVDIDSLIPTLSPQNIKKEIGIPDGIPIIGRLGRIGRDKGVEHFLITCRKLQNKGLNFIPLVVGGEARDHQGYVGKMKLMAECLDIKNIKFVGHKEDVANYLQIIDTFLYPSQTEGFGLVFAEAMLNEALVVAYKTDVTKELFSGYALLADNNFDSLVSCVETSLKQSYRDSLLPIAYDRIVQDFNAINMVKQYGMLYEQHK